MRWLPKVWLLACSFSLWGCAPKDTLPQPRRPVDEEAEEPVTPAPGAQKSTTSDEGLNDAPGAKAESSPPSSGQVTTSPAGAKAQPAKSSAEALASQPLQEKPQEALSLEERRERSSQNLYQIS